ncbi:hypothetical protein evm_000656 [Chilo suppressalis]|nr:hypothetical protein evm_000656 [Chilo suppressalis]
MACALYVACRTSVTPTVQSGTAVESNCKFQPIFQEIFSGLTNEPVKTHIKSKKHKMQPCSTNALFEFTWCLYICVKGEFQKSADDLVDMYHMLLCCLDFVFANAFMARRIDLINPRFKGLPSDWMRDDFKSPDKAPCIISTLSEIKAALPVEAGTMKEYNWKPVIKSFFTKGILKGNSTQLTGILDVGNFDANQKSLNNLYETYVLSVGEFDERIFLGEHASEQIGTKSKVSGDEISEVIATFGPIGRACPDTPLTGRRYLGRRAEELTPVSEATNSLARLFSFLRQTKPQPSSHLLQLFSECGVSEDTINENVIKPCNQWMEKFSNCLESNCSEQTIKLRSNMVTCLYYKVFEHIIREEHRKKPQVSLQLLVTRETYQRAIYACCSEVVLHAYGVHSLRFPRVLSVFDLSPLHFYKVIELVVQAVVEKLSRDIIKHLNTVSLNHFLVLAVLARIKEN